MSISMSWEVALKIGGRFDGAMMAVLVSWRGEDTNCRRTR